MTGLACEGSIWSDYIFNVRKV